jgi:signal transduction histidine kinase
MATLAHPVTMPPPGKWWSGVVDRMLRLPLIVKLVGANAVIVACAWVAAYLDQRERAQDGRLLIVLGIALVAGLFVNSALVVIALRPIRMLELTAARFWSGDFAARVPDSRVADRGIERLSVSLNLLLDSIELDRHRARALTERIIRHDDRERVDVARELHESLAQSLAGLQYTIAAAIAECGGLPECRGNLEAARKITQQSIEQLRQLSGRVHPRLLEEFGLIAALRHMARTMDDAGSSAEIVVNDDGVESMRDVPPFAKSILYRVTEEAVRNAVCHSNANRIEINLTASAGNVVIEVDDDGVGFDPTRIGPRPGLRLMRERLAFLGGECVIRSAPGHGTTVSLRLPSAGGIIEAARHRGDELTPSQIV